MAEVIREAVETLKRQAFVRKINIEDYTLEAYASTVNVDRYNEIILPKAYKKTLKNYLKLNPIVLWGHDYGGLPIGKVLEAKTDELGLWVKIKFAVAEYPFAEQVFKLFAGKYLTSFSVGFRAINWLNPDDQNDIEYTTYTEVELYEISAVTVPANRESVVQAGVSDKNIRDLDAYKEAREALVEGKDTRGILADFGVEVELTNVEVDKLEKIALEAVKKGLVVNQKESEENMTKKKEVKKEPKTSKAELDEGSLDKLQKEGLPAGKNVAENVTADAKAKANTEKLMAQVKAGKVSKTKKETDTDDIEKARKNTEKIMAKIDESHKKAEPEEKAEPEKEDKTITISNSEGEIIKELELPEGTTDDEVLEVLAELEKADEPEETEVVDSIKTEKQVEEIADKTLETYKEPEEKIEKAGAVLNKANKEKLSKIADLANEILASAGSDDDDGKDISLEDRIANIEGMVEDLLELSEVDGEDAETNVDQNVAKTEEKPKRKGILAQKDRFDEPEETEVDQKDLTEDEKATLRKEKIATMFRGWGSKGRFKAQGK